MQTEDIKKLNLETEDISSPEEEKEAPTKVIRPIFDKKTGAICVPYEEKFIQVRKEGAEKDIDVLFIGPLARNRLRVRVDKKDSWKSGDMLTMKGKGVIHTCILKSLKNNKAVIQSLKIEENKEDGNVQSKIS